MIPITLGILVLAFGALVAAALPILVGVMAITIALAIVGTIASVMPMSVFVLNMVSMIGLGVGIDYSLLVVTRFREELNAGLRQFDAAVRTFKTAGHAVLTSGSTVVVGFGALLLTPLSETRSVGVAGLVVVAVAVLLSVTLLPALLAVLGRTIDRPRWLAARLAWYHRPQIWERWARNLSRHPYRASAIGIGVIGLLTLPLLQLKIGLPSRHWWPEQTEAGAGVVALQGMGRAGYLQPVRVVIEFPPGTDATGTTALRGLRRLSDTLRADGRVHEVRSLVDLAPGTGLLEYSMLYGDPEAVRREYPGFLDAYLARDTRTTLLDVILADTTSLTTAMTVIGDIRQMVTDSSIRQLRGATIYVGGYVSSAVDFQELLLARFPLIVGLILGVTAIMLAIAFKSLLVPIKAVIMNTLSVRRTFGISCWCSRMASAAACSTSMAHLGHLRAGTSDCVCCGVWIVDGLRSVPAHASRRLLIAPARNTLATREGLSATASVITSAALIMIAVFGAFAFARILLMQFVGFGLAWPCCWTPPSSEWSWCPA